MPGANRLTDAEGWSTTPQLDEDVQMDTDLHFPVYPPVPEAVVAVQKASPHSLKSKFTSPTYGTTFSSPTERFRASVRKVIALHRVSSFISNRGIGAEPGVDPRRESANVTFGHIQQSCLIEMVEYSSVRSKFTQMSNQQFVELLNDPGTSLREPWVKVRWINVGGISWDVMKALALTFDLHPLALEDVLQRGNARSKADYYPNHLFLRILCHSLTDEGDVGANDAVAITDPRTGLRHATEGLPCSSSPMPLSELDVYESDRNVVDLDGKKGYNDTTAYDSSADVFLRKWVTRGVFKWRLFPQAEQNDISSARAKLDKLEKQAKLKKMQDNVISIQQVKKGERVNVKATPMYIFLFRDGTVISIHPKPNLDFTSPIISRIKSHHTALRTSADASLLLQSLLDLIVDQTLEIVDEYHGKILKLEHDILLKPKMKTNRSLHILSGDLIMLKRTLQPIQSLIYGLRRYDDDRCAALIDWSKAPPGTKAQGFLSHKSKIYLADVYDHMEYCLTSFERFAVVSENLINYTFNMASYELNEIMRLLITTTVTFLPPIVLAGYFGMNFDNMWSVKHDHSDIIFWIIAIPMMSIIIPLFLQQDIRKSLHYIHKRMQAKKAVKGRLQ